MSCRTLDTEAAVAVLQAMSMAFTSMAISLSMQAMVKAVMSSSLLSP